VETTLETTAPEIEEPSLIVQADFLKAKVHDPTEKDHESVQLKKKNDTIPQLEPDIVQQEKSVVNLVHQQPVEGANPVLDPHSVWDNEKLVFIHIGKSGGSSARCMLETNLGEGTCKDGKFLKSLNFRDEYTAIYNRTVALCHQLSCIADKQWRIDHPKAAKPADWSVMNFPGAIVSVRNPIYRILSWYL
jgi:hypothetical protein